MNRYNFEVLELSEVRWNTFGKLRLSTGQVLLYMGKENEDDLHEAGMRSMLSRKASKSLIDRMGVGIKQDHHSETGFETSDDTICIIQCYSPTNNATKEGKNSFYEELRSIVNRVPRRDVPLLMGDVNTEVGSDNAERRESITRDNMELGR